MSWKAAVVALMLEKAFASVARMAGTIYRWPLRMAALPRDARKLHLFAVFAKGYFWMAAENFSAAKVSPHLRAVEIFAAAKFQLCHNS
jgi:hypothetical protein